LSCWRARRRRGHAATQAVSGEQMNTLTLCASKLAGVRAREIFGALKFEWLLALLAVTVC
jgi:hypothetical protein